MSVEASHATAMHPAGQGRRSWLLSGAAAAALLTLAACQGGYPASERLSADFGDVEIRRIGDFDPGYFEYQDRAIVQAFDVMTGAGIDAKAIRKVTVSTPPTPEGFGFGFAPGFGIPANYRLWVAVEGCDKDVYFIAGPSGGLLSSDDKGGCLTGKG